MFTSAHELRKRSSELDYFKGFIHVSYLTQFSRANITNLDFSAVVNYPTKTQAMYSLK